MGIHEAADVVVIRTGGVSARRVRKIVNEALASMADTIINSVKGIIMANMNDLMAGLATLQAGQTETLKDLARLIEQGDTSGALNVVNGLIDTNSQMDAQIEAVSPEPAAPPTDGGAPAESGVSTPAE